MEIYDSTISNTGGQIEAVGPGAEVSLDGAAITGGVVSTSNGVAVETVSSGNVIDGAAFDNAGVLDIANNTSLTLGGAIDNTGTISLNSDNNYRSTLTVDANGVTLEGSERSRCRTANTTTSPAPRRATSSST